MVRESVYFYMRRKQQEGKQTEDARERVLGVFTYREVMVLLNSEDFFFYELLGEPRRKSEIILGWRRCP